MTDDLFSELKMFLISKSARKRGTVDKDKIDKKRCPETNSFRNLQKFKTDNKFRYGAQKKKVIQKLF